MTTTQPSALVTGASRGIGLGVATHLAAQGWALTVTARDADRLDLVADQLRASGGTVQAVAGDMADEATSHAVVDAHAATHGTLNALILAAGVGSAGPLDGYPMRRLDKQWAVNVRAPFALVARAIPLLRAAVQSDPARGARVIALTSIEGIYPQADLAAYGASKAALISLVKSINVEESANGVSASAISPAFVDTDMSAWVADSISPDSMISVADVVKVVDTILSVSANTILPHIVINRRGAGAHHA